MISSCDGKVSKLASAYTAERVTGSMQVVDWSKIRNEAPEENHKGKSLCGPGRLAVLAGGCQGKGRRAHRRLTPLGWTCIGSPEIPKRKFKIFYEMIESLVRRYWDIEELKDLCQTGEKFAMFLSLTFTDGHYVVGCLGKGSTSYLVALIALERSPNSTESLTLRCTTELVLGFPPSNIPRAEIFGGTNGEDVFGLDSIGNLLGAVASATEPQVANCPLLRHWVFCGVPWRMCSSFSQPAYKRMIYGEFPKEDSHLFDPWLAVAYKTCQIVIQEMWASGVDWDEPVDRRLSLKATNV
ncbi:hypothetical protein ACROYT_G009557 [Oculina patagonica]